MKKRREDLDKMNDKGEQIKHASAGFLQMCQELNEKNGGPKAPARQNLEKSPRSDNK